MLSKKINSNEKDENDEIIKTEKRTVKVLNTFFTDIVWNLHTQQYNVDDPIYGNINEPLLKAIVRYRSHPKIAAIKNFVIFHLKMLKKKKFLRTK